MTAAYIEIRPVPKEVPSLSKYSKESTARFRSRAFKQQVTRHDQTILVGCTPCICRISFETKWMARSSRPARDSNLTRIEKVTALGRTCFCRISENIRSPSCKSPALTQPSNREL